MMIRYRGLLHLLTFTRGDMLAVQRGASGSHNDCTLSKDTSGEKNTLAGDMDQVETSELPVQSGGEPCCV